MGWLSGLFQRKSHECAVEADKWTRRSRAARRRGYRALSTECDRQASSFAEAGAQWRRSGREHHAQHLEDTGRDRSVALRPSRR